MTDRWRLAAATAALLIAVGSTATTFLHERLVTGSKPPIPTAGVSEQPKPPELTAAEPAPAAMEEAPLPKPPSKPKPKSVESYQCAGTTKGGRQCRRMIRQGKFCYQHVSQSTS